MNFAGLRILILEGYAKQCLPLIKAFHDLGCDVSALCNSKLDVAYASRYTNHKIIGICNKDDVEGTTRQIRELLATKKYDAVIPTFDFSASILSQNKDEFSKYCKVLANNPDIHKMAIDKNETMRICSKNKIPCPISFFNDSPSSFPIVAKPKTSYGAIGFKRINTKQEFDEFCKKNQETLSNYVIQEYIPQTDIQYECAMFVDNDNEVKTSVVFSKNRWFPISGGSSTLNITVDRPDIIESCSKLLKLINWRGPADIDLIQDPRDGTAKIMEINPRVSGSVKITFLAGTNQALQMLELLNTYQMLLVF